MATSKARVLVSPSSSLAPLPQASAARHLVNHLHATGAIDRLAFALNPVAQNHR